MFSVLDPLKLFIPYIEELSGIDDLAYNAVQLYTSVYGDNTLVGVEMEFINTNSFKRYEQKIRDKFPIIDNTPSTIVIVISKDNDLYDAIELFNEGKFSKLQGFPSILKSYIKGKSREELKNDLEFNVIRKDKTLRETIEMKLNCLLTDDAELGSIPYLNILEDFETN